MSEVEETPSFPRGRDTIKKALLPNSVGYAKYIYVARTSVCLLGRKITRSI